MPKDMIKKSIIAFSALLLLIIACLFRFGSISTAWFREDRKSGMTASNIYSITQCETSSVAPFKNDEVAFDADCTLDDIMGNYEKTIIPGDVLYYAFLILDVDIVSYQTFMMEFAGLLVLEGEGGFNAESFASNLCIEEDTVIFAVLEGTPDGMGGETYELYPYDNGNAFYSITNTGVDHIYTEENGLQADLQFTLPEGVAYPAGTNGKADILVIVPVWYMDTGANQNIEMNCSLTIEGCVLYPFTGGGQ